MNDLFVDDATNAFCGLLQSENVFVFHSYVDELLNRYSSHDFLLQL